MGSGCEPRARSLFFFSLMEQIISNLVQKEEKIEKKGGYKNVRLFRLLSIRKRFQLHSV